MVKFTGLDDEKFLKVARKLDLYSRKAITAVKKNWEDWSRSKRTVHEPVEFRLGVTFKNAWNTHFTGRNQTLHMMGDILKLGEHGYAFQTLVIYGTGGVGKTQLALEYAHRHQNAYASIFWIDARRPDTVSTSMQECVKYIMEQFEIHGMEKSPRFQFLRKEEQAGRAGEAFLTWLAHKDNRRWLLIIDNLDDIESVSLRDVIPFQSQGSVLVTSRRSDLAITFDAIHIPPMDHDEAFTLLRLSSQMDTEKKTEDWRSAQALLRKLAYLPLAISQAGAYISMNPSETPFSDYLNLYQELPREILNQKAGKLVWDEKHDTVLNTWETSFEAIQRRMPTAAEVLLISGFLAPEGIAQEIFTSGNFSSQLQVQQAFQILRSFSLFQQSVGNSEVSVHPLVHLWARLRLNLDDHKTTLNKTASMLYVCMRHSRGRHHVNRHISHFYSIYTKTESLNCTSPFGTIDLSLARYDVPKRGNVFNLYPYGRAMHTALASVILIRRTISQLFLRPPKTIDVVMQEMHFFEEAKLHFSMQDNAYLNNNELEHLYQWMFCRATLLFPSQDPIVIDNLFMVIGYFSLQFSWEHSALYSNYYNFLLIWYGELAVERHPVVAGIQIGFGLSLRTCHQEMRDLWEAYTLTTDFETFYAWHVKVDLCLASRTLNSEPVNDVFRTIASWSLAVTVFRYQESSDESLEVETHALGVTWERDATDPFSRAVLEGNIGDDADILALYLLLQLLDWKKSACLISWPSSLAYLARHFNHLAGNHFGEESVRQLEAIWSDEYIERLLLQMYHLQRCFARKIDTILCLSGPDNGWRSWMGLEWRSTGRNALSVYMSKNNVVCQKGQLALYLSMWYAGTGIITGSNKWLLDIYETSSKSPSNSIIQWQERCHFQQELRELPQVRLSFLDDASIHGVADYETDRVFDYIANAAVDILRGFHHNAIQKGRFSKDGTQEWLGISKSMAHLLLRPGMQKAASQDAYFADFLVRSGNVPEGPNQETKRALRAWDTYGKRCPGRMLRQTIVDHIGWFTPQGALPWSCWVDNPLSTTCPAAQNGLRTDEELIERDETKSFIKRIWNGLRRSGGGG